MCDCHLSHAADRAVYGSGELLEGGEGGGDLVVVSLGLLRLLRLGVGEILGLVVGEAVAVLHAASLGILFLIYGY
jgi:hypothetical protein